MTAVRIIGLGSPFGDDRLGWAAIEALREAALPPNIELHRVASPASELLPLFEDAARVILVDAIVDSETPGRLVRCEPGELRRRTSGVSSHGVSIDTMLDIAAALQTLPAELVLLGVAVDPDIDPGEQAFTPPVAAALPALIAAVADAARAPAQSP